MSLEGLTFTWCGFDAFDAPTLYEILRFRQDVFIVEQGSAYPDLDGLDPDCTHLLVRDSAGKLAAYLRLRGPVGDEPAFIGRIVVGSTWRGTGLGRSIIQRALNLMKDQHPSAVIEIGAQAHLTEYYAGFGFILVGEPYDDGGIPHVTMRIG